MKFSIVTCTYNSDKYLQKNIDSVRNQIFDDFEHIFIDGFSTDKTLEIIEKYRQEFPEKVKLFQYPAKGIGNAMNKGVERSSGEYINHLHSDDSFYDNNVLLNIDQFTREKKDYPDLIYGKAKFISENSLFKIIPHRRIYHKFRYWLLLLTNYIPHQATFVKKTVFEKYGLFNEKYKNSMDYEMWLRLSKGKVNSCFFNSIISNFSMRTDSQSAIGGKNSVIENIDIQKKYIGSKLLRLFLVFIIKMNSKRKLV
ncbi:MAG: glycosyltransferase family 2 protein [Candidatus Moranbacteria bacterium]|nr:glycosyltransferase family 2 protein [Candidatus Moranbacteria bacterium]